MKVTVDIEEIDYGAAAKKIMPILQRQAEQSRDRSKIMSVLSKAAALGGNAAASMMDLLPSDLKNEIVALLVNSNKKKIIEAIENAAKKQEIPLRVGDINVETDE